MQSLVPLFPEVTPAQWEQLTAMAALHREWNEKINLVSRKDIENLERVVQQNRQRMIDSFIAMETIQQRANQQLQFLQKQLGSTSNK